MIVQFMGSATGAPVYINPTYVLIRPCAVCYQAA
jgi:hypothetical protein